MTLRVNLGKRSYPILIEPGCLVDAGQWQALTDHAEVVIVTNETVAPLYLDSLIQALERPGRTCRSVILPDGEAFKTTETLGRIYDFLLEHKVSRKAVLVALGGGVIGDVTGFAAATYQRGVDFIQVPTTLLSQVDSSVGGKTGINHPLGKNMIGAFKQPIGVVIDPQVLRTLPGREVSAGLAEVIKYGLICDAGFFEWLEHRIELLIDLDVVTIAEAITRSCRLKADVVASDETEQGRRAILNLGHTFGHAIEAEMGYGTWLHGEAVAVGMVMACDLSQRLGWIDREVTRRTIGVLRKAGLPVTVPAQMTPARFLEHMARDKKVESGRLRLVLLRNIGDAIVTADFPVEQLERCLASFCDTRDEEK